VECQPTKDAISIVSPAPLILSTLPLLASRRRRVNQAGIQRILKGFNAKKRRRGRPRVAKTSARWWSGLASMDQRGRKIAGTVSRFTARSLLLLARFISTYDEDTSITTVVSTSGACATIHATPTSEAKPQSLSECIRTCGCNRHNCSGRERYIHT